MAACRPVPARRNPYQCAGLHDLCRPSKGHGKPKYRSGYPAFILLKYVGVLRWKISPSFLFLGGGIVGFLSGLVGSAGPLGAAIFLTLSLTPSAYIATEAITALGIHGVKMAVYQRYVPLNGELLWLAGFIGLAMILGNWSGKRLIERLPRDQFQRYVTGLLTVIAAYMVVHG